MFPSGFDGLRITSTKQEATSQLPMSYLEHHSVCRDVVWSPHRWMASYELLVSPAEIPLEIYSHALHDIDAERVSLCRWKGAASDIFLLEAMKLMESKGYILGNIDVTIIAERPKISPHKQLILDNLYSLLKTPAETINIKVRIPS